MKVAIIHYWLVNMRGGEKVLQALCELFPKADIYTHVHDAAAVGNAFPGHQIKTSFIQKLPGAKRYYQNYLPLMPLALEQLDLRGYDLVISSESGPAKGVITSPDTVHICYCHSPMRYAWDMYHEYRANASWLRRLVMPSLMHYVRQWDLASASRVDCFVANSRFVAGRIKKYYRRDAEVIHPPIVVDDFITSDQQDDYYLMVGQLTPYKRADLAVEAFNQSGRKLVVIGDGEQLKSLQQLAQPNVKIMGRQPFDVIREHYSKCQALIFPGVEDFGMVPIEAMASGRPVIAYARGGALETVRENLSGLFFHEQTIESLNASVAAFEAGGSFDSCAITEYARDFDKSVFNKNFMAVVDRLIS